MKHFNASLEEYFKQILEQSQNGIIISDPNRQNNPVIFVNKAVCKKFGYSKSDFLGRNCSFLQAEDKNQPQIKQISKAIEEQKSITTTLRNYTKDGELIYNQFTISPIFDRKKNLKYFFGIQRDVTNEVQLKEENDALHEEQIDNALYNAIGKLYGGLSHEINTPLTIINGHLEMLKNSLESLEKSDLKIQALEDIALIEENFNRIKNITESMRETSDINGCEIDKINLYRALVIALRLTHNKAKSITKIKLLDQPFNLDIDREKEKYIIQGDHRKLEQVFVSIIDNALDQFEMYGNKDHNLLRIDIIPSENHYQLIFQDNGGGVDDELLRDIYKPFKGNKEHKGLGIGLSLVKNILDQHGFHITIQNNNQGLQVIITIPHKN